MRFIDRSGATGDGDYAVFEQALLSSAGADGPPTDAAKRAWDKFAIAMGTAAAAAGTPVKAGIAAHSWGRLTRVRALKWVFLGAIGGSGLTALSMNARPTTGRSSTGTSPPAVSVRLSVPTTDVRGGDPIQVRKQAVDQAVDEEDHKEATISHRRPRTVAARREEAANDREPRRREESPTAAHATEDSVHGDRISNLAAEVALVDAARSAISQGDFAPALRLVERYRETFPNGELARDVDVVAIEALAAQGDRDGVMLQGKRFLERHPNDPQVARIKALVAH